MRIILGVCSGQRLLGCGFFTSVFSGNAKRRSAGLSEAERSELAQAVELVGENTRKKGSRRAGRPCPGLPRPSGGPGAEPPEPAAEPAAKWT